MKTVTFEAIAEIAYGKKLETPIKYNGSFEAFETIAEVTAANELMKDQEIVDFRNVGRKSTARQRAQQAAFDAAGIVKPTLENDDQLKLKKMYEIFMAVPNTSHDEARAKASAALNIEWAE